MTTNLSGYGRNEPHKMKRNPPSVVSADDPKFGITEDDFGKFAFL